MELPMGRISQRPDSLVFLHLVTLCASHGSGMVHPIDLGPSPGSAVRGYGELVTTHFLMVDHKWTTTETDAISRDGSLPGCHRHEKPPGTTVVLIAILAREGPAEGQWLERRDIDLLVQPLNQIVIFGVEPQSVTSVIKVIPSEHLSLTPERYNRLLTGSSDKLPLVEVIKEPSQFTYPFEDVLKLLLGLLKGDTGVACDAELQLLKKAAYGLKYKGVLQQQADNICTLT